MFYVSRVSNPHYRDDIIGPEEAMPMMVMDFVPPTPPSTPTETTELNEPRMLGALLRAAPSEEALLPSTSRVDQVPGPSAEPQPSTSFYQPQPSTSHYEPQPSTSNYEPQPSTSTYVERPGSTGAVRRASTGSGIAPRAEPETDDDEFFEAETGDDSQNSPVPFISSLSIASEMNLHSALRDCEQAITLFFNNNLDEAIAIMTPWKDVSLYHAHGAAIFDFIPAMLTLDPAQIRKANDALRHTFDLCSRHRRNYNFVQSLGAIIKKPNYGGYTEEEAHAELVYAEAGMLQACLGALEGEDVSGLVKASLRIKSSFNGYRTCSKILIRKDWENEKCKAHFESGVRLGLATFNVMISLMPPRLISVLEFIGFTADKVKGINELLTGAKSPGLRSVLCALTLLIYYLVIGHFAAISTNYPITELLISNGLSKYPKSVWFTMFKARMQLLRGMVNEAVDTYRAATRTDKLWPQLKHLCYWEMVFAFGIMMKWSDAAFYAARLATESKWSRTIYMYTQAAMLLENGNRISEEQKRQCDMLLRRATNYRQRLLGRSLPMEKFVIRRCERWVRRGYFALPGVELMCLWNIFPPLAAEPHYADRMLKHIEKMSEDIELALRSRNGVSENHIPQYNKEDLALVHFLYGSLLAAMSLPRLALRRLELVLPMKDDIKDSSYLIPYALVEIAMCHYALGDAYHAIDMLQDVRKKYTGYLLEARLQFRIHSKLEIIHAGEEATVVAGTTASAVALSSVNALPTRPSTQPSTSTAPPASASVTIENRPGRISTREVLNTIADSRVIMAARAQDRARAQQVNPPQTWNPGHPTRT